MPPVEQVPGGDRIHRQIDFPNMYNDVREMIWHNVFQFSGGEPESVVWSKYAPTADDVHRIGCERETNTRGRKPDIRYIGFISSTVGEVRGINTRAGHGFAVVHEPSEGIYHAHIYYRPGGERAVDQLKKGEKNELKLARRGAFGNLISHSCP